MGAYDVTAGSPELVALRDALGAMQALSERDSVNLVELAKAYQTVAAAMAALACAAGRPSLRFDVIVRALDLTTPKSALRAFLEG